MYTDYLKHVQKLSMEQRGMLFTAILCYASGHEIPELDLATDMIFGVIQERIDRDTASYLEKIQKRAEAGKLGGLAKSSNAKQNVAKSSNAKTDVAIVADNVNDNENGNDKDIKRLAPDDKSPCAGKFLLNDATEYEVSENDVVYYQQLYPGIDVMQELRNVEAWCFSNPKQRKTRNGAKRFLNAWLSRAQNSARAEARQVKAKPQNSFNNFSQRSYDYDELERDMLNSSPTS